MKMIKPSFLLKDVTAENPPAVYKYSRSDLPYWAILPKDVIHFLSSDLIRKIPDVQDPVHLWR